MIEYETVIPLPIPLFTIILLENLNVQYNNA